MSKNVLDCLMKRGFIEQISDDELNALLDKPISFYIGFDPTADSLHLGNLVGIIALCWFLKFNHNGYVLIGGATGKIGDPSGKSKERPFLNEPILNKNILEITTFLEGLLKRTAKNSQLTFVNNQEWFDNILFIDFLREVGKQFRLGPMLAKESVRLRLNSEEGMSFTEFSYQMMQAYDFHHLFSENKIKLQLGGSDQWGNITSGIELIRKLHGEKAFGITFPLLTRSDGKKFGKSESGAIWLSSNKLSPYEFYQHLFNISDADVIKLLKMLTFLDIEEINSIEESMKNPNYTPNTAQKILAKEVTGFVHGDDGLDVALRVTENAKPGFKTILNKETLEILAKDMNHITLPKENVLDKSFVDILVLTSLVKSKSEAVRLIQNGGAYLNNERVNEKDLHLSASHLIDETFLLFGVGKKKKLLVTVSSH